MNFITVLHTCHGCGLQRCRVLVAARRPDEDITKWMEYVGIQIGKHHYNLAPTCTAETADIAIPLPPDEPDAYIGSPRSADIPDELGADFLKSKRAN
jgi:hypothetical protein